MDNCCILIGYSCGIFLYILGYSCMLSFERELHALLYCVHGYLCILPLLSCILLVYACKLLLMPSRGSILLVNSCILACLHHTGT